MKIGEIDAKYIIIGIAVVLALFYFLGCFETSEQTMTIPDGAVSCSVSGSKANLPEGYIEEQNINWDECCVGFITVSLDYEWDFFYGEDAEECDSGYPVIWTVTDSSGSEVFSSEEYVPTATIEIFRGYWDCMHPWEISILNQCACSETMTFPAITLEWDMTMVCD